jgi:uncharacterized repeat protein (TIGR03803 family)
MQGSLPKSSPQVVLVVLAIILLTTIPSWAGSMFVVLHSFPNDDGNDGDLPTGSLVFDASGNLYGTATGGGTYIKACDGGCGVVFKMTPDAHGVWTESVLHSFDADVDGAFPAAGLTFGAQGNLYGTTSSGGGDNDGGTIFELKSDSSSSTGWTVSVIHRFCHSIHICKDGSNPWYAGVVIDGAGRLYGTTRDDGIHQGGVAYMLTATNEGWKETILYSFCAKQNCEDGYRAAWATPILDKDGNLYGTAQAGGTGNADGVVFKLSHTSSGWKETFLHSFQGPDGSTPIGGLVFDAEGDLYGTTQAGGKNGSGTVFKLTPAGDGSWKHTILYDFPQYRKGAGPVSTLMLDKVGNLYGTAAGGIGPCSGGCGVVYRLAPSSSGKWNYTVLHRFTDATNDGAEAYATPVFDKTGKHLYGTTAFGGTYNQGVVYEITP